MDMKKFHKQAAAMEDENWEFRSWLKMSDWSDEEMDEAVHDLYREIGPTIDCRECGGCCQSSTNLTKNDIARLSRFLNLSTVEFLQQHTVPSDDPDEECENMLPGEPCHFYRNCQCHVYEARPEVCRSFPHLHKPEFRSRLIGMVNFATYCPIVFEVMQRLKAVMHYRKRR